MTTPAATTDPIRLWGRVEVPASATEMAAVRMSDPEAREELGKLKDSLRHQTAGSSIGAALASLGPDVTEDSPDGERDRRLAGLVPVMLSDLDPRAPQRLLAYAGMVGGVLVTLIPSSAIESDLPPYPGDRTKSPRNGATELVLEAVVTLPALSMLAAPRLNRLLRRIAFQGRVLDTLREHDVQVWTDSGVLDLMNSNHMVMANLEGTTKGDGAAIQLKQDTMGGRINALDPGAGFSRRDFRHHSCPIGYTALLVDMPDGSRVAAKGSIVPRLEDADAIRMIWKRFAAGATRGDIAEAVGPLGLRLRDGTGRTLRDVSAGRGAGVVSRLLTPETARLHQTGEWVRERSTSAPIRQAGGRTLSRRPDGRRAVTISGRLEVPLINDLPWGIEAEVWAAVTARFDRERRATPAQRGGEWSAGLMHSSPLFWTVGAWHRFVREHTTLQLRRIKGGTPETQPEWDPTVSELVASVNYTHAWNLIGAALLRSAALAGARYQEVAVPPGAESVLVRKLREELAVAEGQARESENAAAAAGQLAVQAHAGGYWAASRDHLSKQEEYIRAEELARSRADHLTLELAEVLARPRDERADVLTPLAVATALLRWNGSADRDLKAAVAALELVRSMRGTYDPTTGDIGLTCTAKVVTAEGIEGVIPVEVDMPNTSNARPLDVADAVLVKRWATGVPLSELAARYNRTERWIRRALYRWLRSVGIDTMAPSLVSNPVVVTRQAVVASVAPSLVRMPTRMSNGDRLTKATVSLLTAPYLADAGGAWESWTGYAHGADRRLLAVLRVAGGQADVAALAQAAGADPAWLGRRLGNRPALTTSAALAMRRLRECPHADCPNPWASHLLYVPETAGFAVLCPRCRRFPDLAFADTPLPPEYVAKWDRGSVDGRAITVRSSAAALRIPDPALARVAGDLARPTEVARILGVTLGTVGDLRRRGVLPRPVLSTPVSLWRRTECVALAATRSQHPREAIKDGLLSPAKAASRLGVAEHRVRQYCADGSLAYKRIGQGKSSRVRIKPEVVAAFQPPPGDLLVALTVADVCRRSQCSRDVVLAAMEEGELGWVPSSSGQRRIMPAQYETWVGRRLPAGRPQTSPPLTAGRARNGDGRLSVAAAAIELGLSPKQVRRLADKGELDDHRTGETGWRWFDADEVARFRARMTG